VELLVAQYEIVDIGQHPVLITVLLPILTRDHFCERHSITLSLRLSSETSLPTLSQQWGQ
jgi:hypothetical protein